MYERHGLIKHPIYVSWRAIKQRCLNPNSTGWEAYGARGITLCDAWKDFLPFYTWAIENGWKPGLSIERVDVDGNYEPSNCVWATALEQANNKRPRLAVTVRGRTLNVRQWAKETGIFVTTLYKRYHAGIRGEDFIAPPKNPAIAKPI
jgi:hypothetical protein